MGANTSSQTSTNSDSDMFDLFMLTIGFPLVVSSMTAIALVITVSGQLFVTNNLERSLVKETASPIQTERQTSSDSYFGSHRQRLSDHDFEASNFLFASRDFVYWAPLASTTVVITLPTMLLNSDLPHFSVISISVFWLGLLHILNVCNLHRYFAWVARFGNKFDLGSTICTATEELSRSKGFFRIYLYILFTLCLIPTWRCECTHRCYRALESVQTPEH